MERRVTRRTVTKLAYAAPLVAATMTIDGRTVAGSSHLWNPIDLHCTPDNDQCQCLDGAEHHFTRIVNASIEDSFCGSCDPRVAVGPLCDASYTVIHHSDETNCVLPDGRLLTNQECRPDVRFACFYCGPGRYISQP